MSVNEVRLKKAAKPFEIRGTGPETSRTFAIGDEDHTIGNSLRHVLMNSADTVSFAGYSVPHPSEPVMHLRVQTHEGSVSAVEALRAACGTLHAQCDIMLEKLDEVLPEVREDTIQLDAKLKAMEEEEGEEDIDDGEQEGGEDGMEVVEE